MQSSQSFRTPDWEGETYYMQNIRNMNLADRFTASCFSQGHQTISEFAHIGRGRCMMLDTFNILYFIEQQRMIRAGCFEQSLRYVQYKIPVSRVRLNLPNTIITYSARV